MRVRLVLCAWRGPWLALLLSSAAVAAPAAAQEREVVALRDGWEFHYAGDAKADVPAADARWARVSVPHTWNRFGEYRLQRSPGIDNRQGVGWYRLSLDAADLPRGTRRYLQFDGVGNIADVWVDGVHVGRHAGAFSRFRLDVTDALKPEARHLVLVRADNRRPAPGATTQDVVPLLGDFFIHGGLYRAVSLIGVDALHVDLLDHGGPGIAVRTPRIAPEVAEVAVRVRLRNDGDSAREAMLEVAIEDAGGRVSARTMHTVRLAARTDASPDLRLALPHPRLWDGRRDPYLYRVVATVRDGARVVDRVTQPLGVRSVRIDADRGLFLNGRHLPLHGVSRHQDSMGKGWALEDADHVRDMALITELGANTVRFAHYPHAQAAFEAADRAGLLVWAELPFVNKVSFADAPASAALVANARQQLVEMIRQHRNHPSVVTWGIGNEVDIDLAFGRLGPKADARPLLRELHALARAEDPERPTVLADCCEATPGDKLPGLPVLAGIADLMGYNRYFGWYYGDVDDLGAHLDALHAAHPRVPISVSEYGAGGALSQHTDNPQGGPIASGGRPHPEAFQSWWHERSWPQIAARPYLWASWIWNMFDFASNIRQEGDATDINDKGLVSYDRKVRKDAFHYYRAQWSDAPVVHVTGRRYVRRAYPVTDVRVYSNAPRVGLRHNGRPLGEVACERRVCVLRDVGLSPGDNRIEAHALFDGRTVGDAVTWDAPDAAAGLSINVGDLSGFVDARGRRTGSDHWFDGGTPRRLDPALDGELSGTGDVRLRTGYREGRFGYAIPLPAGRWRVTLLFVEPRPRADTARSFDVVANGRTVLSAFDPARAAGGPLAGIERSFEVQVDDGALALDFVPVRGDAVLSAITIHPLR